MNSTLSQFSFTLVFNIMFWLAMSGEIQAQRLSLAELVSQIEALQTQVSDLEEQVLTLEEKQVVTTSITGFGIGDGSDSGDLGSRMLVFEKTRETSRLRITYNDNLRVIGGTEADNNWTIKLDGSPLPIGTRLFVSPGVNNIHRQSTVIGYVDGISAGTHQLTVNINNTTGHDVFTGLNSSFLLQVEELPPEGK